MIEQIDKELQDWLATIPGVASISLEPPPLKQGISLYLMSLGESSPMRTNRRSPLNTALHYLVTSWHKDPAQAHTQLSQLLFASLEHPDYEVCYDHIDYHLWQLFGIAPQPAFVLRVIASLERPEPVIPRVQEPRVETVPAVPLTGRVLGPDDVPLAGAYVQLPVLQLSRRTDTRGKFYFPNVPGDSVQVLVRAKGVERRMTIDRENKEPIEVIFESF